MRYGRKKNCVFLRRNEKNVYFCNAKEVAATVFFADRCNFLAERKQNRKAQWTGLAIIPSVQVDRYKQIKKAK